MMVLVVLYFPSSAKELAEQPESGIVSFIAGVHILPCNLQD